MEATRASTDAPRPRWVDWLQISFFCTFARMFATLFLGLRVNGPRRLPGHGPLVVVANHASHIDTLALLSLFPIGALRRVRPVAAADYFLRNRVVAWSARTFFNILPISRDGSGALGDPVKCMTRALDRGEVLILFPEGTRGGGEQMARFRTGVGRLLEGRPGVEVLCVGLENTGRSLPRGAWLPVPFFVDVNVGSRQVVEGDARAIADELERRVRALRAEAAPSPVEGRSD